MFYNHVQTIKKYQKCLFFLKLFKFINPSQVQPATRVHHTFCMEE